MRACLSGLVALLGALVALLLFLPGPARSEPSQGAPRVSERGAGDASNIDDSTWVDNDRHPIQRPPDWAPDYWGRQFRHGLVEPLSHAFDIPDKILWAAGLFGARSRREAVNVNAFDEAPNSAWFTNRNHRRSVPVSELRQGPDSVFLPTKPWTIKHAKQHGYTFGFQIKDAEGRKWLVKLDPVGYPQLSSGADMISRTLLHAAGYNVAHNEPVRFRREDLTIDPDLLRGAEGEFFSPANLESVLVKGAVFPDGSHSGFASLFLPDHVLGASSMDRLRPGDGNDWYEPTNRRELRGLFVLCSWISDWDTKDQQFLDTFIETRDSLGHTRHYILDTGSSFGAAARGPKSLPASFENTVDFGWTARRFVTLGFVQEPWRRARQKSGIPSVGNFESDVYKPQDFKQLVPHPAFREMTDRDGYWGAKIVASFSDEQIEAAVAAANYDEPRASEFIVRNLIVRRDKIARHWFDRVAPLDFFEVEDGALRFHDIAVDIGLAPARAYEVDVEVTGGRDPEDGKVSLRRPAMSLEAFGKSATRLSLRIFIVGNSARPTHVELTRVGSEWTVTRVKHG